MGQKKKKKKEQKEKEKKKRKKKKEKKKKKITWTRRLTTLGYCSFIDLNAINGSLMRFASVCAIAIISLGVDDISDMMRRIL